MESHTMRLLYSDLVVFIQLMAAAFQLANAQQQATATKKKCSEMIVFLACNVVVVVAHA